MSGSCTLAELTRRVEQFSPQKKRLLKERLQSLGIVMPSRGGRLIGFYQTSGQIDEETLRLLCASRLPAHMVPQRFIAQEQLALTPTGKLDRNAMRVRLWSAKDQVVSNQDMIAARNEVEATLVEIWSDVLGLKEVSVYDNFFEAGGDSLQIIRILARASKAGLTIKPDAIFAHPTIAELAQFAGPVAERKKKHVAAHGPVPLLPIQRWFFDVVKTNPHHWNQSYLFKLKCTVASFRAACGQLMSIHPALRARFVEQGGAWTSTIAESMEPLVIEHSLESGDGADEIAEMAAISNEQNANLNLADGPLFKIIHFQGNDGAGYLNLIAHHLVVDVVSWQIIVNDLQQLLSGRDHADLMPDTRSPIRQWAEELHALAGGTTLQSSADYWIEHAHFANVGLAGNADGGARNPEGDCKWVTRELDERLTEKLRTQAPKELRASIQELLLSALVRVLTGWTNSSSLTLDLEGHGREALVDGVDVSQTVGWFTTAFPINFVAAKADDWASPVDSLKRVKDQLRAVPEKGLSYGLFKYLASGAPVAEVLNKVPPSNVIFNYLGVEAGSEDAAEMLSLVDNRFGVTRRADTERAYQLELNAVIRDDRLSIDWAFGPALHSQELIERLADDMMSNIVDLLEGTDSRTVASPTDLPMAGLDQAALDNLAAQLDGLDDD